MKIKKFNILFLALIGIAFLTTNCPLGGDKDKDDMDDDSKVKMQMTSDLIKALKSATTDPKAKAFFDYSEIKEIDGVSDLDAKMQKDFIKDDLLVAIEMPANMKDKVKDTMMAIKEKIDFFVPILESTTLTVANLDSLNTAAKANPVVHADLKTELKKVAGSDGDTFIDSLDNDMLESISDMVIKQNYVAMVPGDQSVNPPVAMKAAKLNDMRATMATKKTMKKAIVEVLEEDMHTAAIIKLIEDAAK